MANREMSSTIVHLPFSIPFVAQPKKQQQQPRVPKWQPSFSGACFASFRLNPKKQNDASCQVSIYKVNFEKMKGHLFVRPKFANIYQLLMQRYTVDSNFGDHILSSLQSLNPRLVYNSGGNFTSTFENAKSRVAAKISTVHVYCLTWKVARELQKLHFVYVQHAINSHNWQNVLLQKIVFFSYYSITSHKWLYRNKLLQTTKIEIL